METRQEEELGSCKEGGSGEKAGIKPFHCRQYHSKQQMFRAQLTPVRATV